jgi:mannitol-specific phosphotransferase system IIBC component
VTADHDQDIMDLPHDTTDQQPERAPFLTRRLRNTVAAVLAALVVAALVLLLLELLVLRPRYEDAQSAKATRADVVRVAERFTAEVNNYKVSSIDQYQKSITPLLTTKFQGEFKQAMGDIVKSVKQARMSSEGNVLASAVASVDPDSAQVLVVSDADVKTIQGPRQRHFRWEVSLVKVDGKWLVDDFQPVA